MQRAAAQAKEAFKNGIITAAQYDQAVAQAKVRTDELAASAAAVGQQAETGYAQASQAAERYGHTVRQAADGHKEVGRAAQASAQTAGGAWGNGNVARQFETGTVALDGGHADCAGLCRANRQLYP